MKPDYFIELAVRTAFKSNSKFRLGAVLAKRNIVLNTAVNKMNKTHPTQQRYSEKDFSVGQHAELRCCIGVPLADLERSTLYVARVLKNGTPALSKPCPGCESFLRDYKIRKVFYTVSRGVIDCVEF